MSTSCVLNVLMASARMTRDLSAEPHGSEGGVPAAGGRWERVEGLDSSAGWAPRHLDQSQRDLADWLGSAGAFPPHLLCWCDGCMTRPSPSSRDLTPLPGQPASSLDHLPPERLGPGNRPAAAPRALSLAFLVLRQNSFRTTLTLFQGNPGNRPHLGQRSWAVSVC